MLRHTYIVALIGLSLSSARALEPAKWPSGPVAKLPKGEYILSEDTTLQYDAISFEDGTVVTTAGHDFDLTVRQALTIDGTLTIRSFAPSDKPSKPASISKASDGRSYDRGPATEGATAAADGENGSSAAPGLSGMKGFDAGIVMLRFDANASVTGKLIVRNLGGEGGTGGDGGQGGNGGNGQQGGRGKDGPFDCASGPGTGGRGGNGGNGGPGGQGGPGGRGGLIVLQSTSSVTSSWLATVEMDISGGPGGQQGGGGAGGLAGLPGYGGRGSHHCQGKEADRMGAPGVPGQQDNNSQVPPSLEGPKGRIKQL
jgi:hypothetical protein